MFAVGVCSLPATGGTTGFVFVGLSLLVAGVIAARWVRSSVSRMSVVVAPLVLLGGLVLVPQIDDPCVPSATTTVASATTTVAPSTTTVAATTTTSTTTTTTTTTTIALTCATGGTCVVGNTGPGGGIVFYDAGSMQSWGRYLEAAPVGVEVQRTWATGGNQSLSVSGADGTAIGTGEKNTEDIVLQSGNAEASSAAVYCSELDSGGQSDWFLPSKDELNLMYTNLHNVNPRLGGFSSVYYWSSSEFAASLAWEQGFDDGNPGHPTFNKRYGNYVRPVRAF